MASQAHVEVNGTDGIAANTCEDCNNVHSWVAQGVFDDMYMYSEL